jgi:hypothetical protein
VTLSSGQVTGTLSVAKGGTGQSLTLTSAEGGHVLNVWNPDGFGLSWVFRTGLINYQNITPGGVSYSRIQDVSATDKILGRSSPGAGSIEEITCTAAGRALIDDADAAAQRATLSAPEITTGTFTPTWSGFSVAPSGDIRYTRIWDGTRGLVTLTPATAGSGLTGTGNGTAWTISGLPSAIRPITARRVLSSANTVEEVAGNAINGLIEWNVSTGGVLTPRPFQIGASSNLTVANALLAPAVSGCGLSANWEITYPI